MTEAYIYDAVRTPLGKGTPEGSLYEFNPAYLLEILLNAIQRRNNGIGLEQVQDLIVGCTQTTGDQEGNIAEKALLTAGFTGQTTGFQVNRSRVSGLESILLAASKVRSGWAQMTLAGGVESYSKFATQLAVDFPDFYFRGNNLPGGIAADLTATLSGFSRENLDEYALHSHQKAREAAASGLLKAFLEPVCDANGLAVLAEDELLSEMPSMDTLAGFPPIFEAEGKQGFDQVALQRFPAIEKVRHLHTACNTAPGADGAALLLIGDRQTGDELGLKPRARIAAAFTTADQYFPRFPAVGKILELAGKQPKDIDLWACSEYTAAFALKFQRDFNLPAARYNPFGGNIAFGFPPGCGATVSLIHLLEALEKKQLKTGVVSATDAGVHAAILLDTRC